jgi:2-polyprenyl-3-methyl-5-hydroxy-6-metoxy-1,4-benzoquinol methylase
MRESRATDYVDNRAGLAGKRVLDVGRGGGLLSEAMAGRGAKVTGIDLGPQTIEVAELHALKASCRELRARSCRDARGSQCGRVRHRRLHGDAGARAGAG